MFSLEQIRLSELAADSDGKGSILGAGIHFRARGSGIHPSRRRGSAGIQARRIPCMQKNLTNTQHNFMNLSHSLRLIGFEPYSADSAKLRLDSDRRTSYALSQGLHRSILHRLHDIQFLTSTVYILKFSTGIQNFGGSWGIVLYHLSWQAVITH